MIQPAAGTWPSPLHARDLAEDTRLSELAWDAATDTLVWLEGRSGRGVLVAQAPGDDAPRDLLRAQDVRGEVGCGGGDFGVHGGVVFFAERRTGRLWRQPLAGGSPSPITPGFGAAAAPSLSPDGRFVAYLHHEPGDTPAAGVDRIAVVDALGACWPRILVEGADFYAYPRFSSDGSRFAFVAWDHPGLAWEGCTLYVGHVAVDGGGLPRLHDVQAVAGGDRCSVQQPIFTPDGRDLLYISDASGFSHLYRRRLDDGAITQLSSGDAEYGVPQWAHELRTYALLAGGRAVVCARAQAGVTSLERIELDGGERRSVDGAGYTAFAQLTASPSGERVACLASSSVVPTRLVVLDAAAAPRRPRIAARSSTEATAPEALSTCRPIRWETAGGETCHGIFYPPHPRAPADAAPPPLLVMVHGGPTGQTLAAWDARSQFFATRGWAVLWPNYRGSTGYGRAYMERLRHAWGVVDVEDAVSGARALAARGEVDPRRTAIAGGSAGGYTVLQTLIREPEAFAAGLCFYGVTDLFAIARDTHKYEAHYDDWLVGSLPEAADLYRERSPVFHAERIVRPVAIFQGADDNVVPPAQAEAIVAALRRRGVPHEYHLYAGEGHGFRKAETLEHFYRSMDAFLLRHVIYT